MHDNDAVFFINLILLYSKWQQAIFYYNKLIWNWSEVGHRDDVGNYRYGVLLSDKFRLIYM